MDHGFEKCITSDSIETKMPFRSVLVTKEMLYSRLGGLAIWEPQKGGSEGTRRLGGATRVSTTTRSRKGHRKRTRRTFYKMCRQVRQIEPRDDQPLLIDLVQLRRVVTCTIRHTPFTNKGRREAKNLRATDHHQAGKAPRWSCCRLVSSWAYLRALGRKRKWQCISFAR